MYYPAIVCTGFRPAINPSAFWDNSNNRCSNTIRTELNERDDSTSIVLEYINCVNAGDSERLAALQTEDFTFVDMAGNRFVGRDGWESYFTEFPEYRIHVKQILLSGDGVAIIGKTTGSHLDPKIEVLETVLWIAEVRNGLVSFWRIYSDLTETKEILRKSME